MTWNGERTVVIDVLRYHVDNCAKCTMRSDGSIEYCEAGREVERNRRAARPTSPTGGGEK